MRNRPLAVVVVSLCLSVPAAWAVDEHHPERQGATGQPTASAGMDEKQMLKMQDSMLKMHDQMHRIQQAKDPRERARLRQEHMKLMHEHMGMMHGPGGMMGGGMHGEGMMQMQKPAAPGKK